jgi:ketosteroid isomerase-like protein
MEAGLGTVDAGATPEAISQAFAAAVVGRDPEAAGACLAAEGCLLTPDGTEVRGRAQMREVLAQLAVTHTQIRVELGRVLTAGAVAVAAQNWTLSSKGPHREPFERSHAALLVLGREKRGWRVTIVAPWGL